MTKQLIISKIDLDLIQEAVSYMSKRFFSPNDSILLNEIEERLDDTRRELSTQDEGRLILNDNHYHLFQRVMLAYADELNHPSSDLSNRQRIERLQELGRSEKKGASLLRKIRSWLLGR